MLLQGGLTVGHRTHNPKIGGSIPPPALIVQRGYQRNLLNAEKRQGRSADRFLLTTGIFQMSHTF